MGTNKGQSAQPSQNKGVGTNVQQTNRDKHKRGPVSMNGADKGQPAQLSGDKGMGTNRAANEHELGPVSMNRD